ncbi:MAG: DUF418 domain-containing protein [Nesterenkonia sp.]|nr:DUF418 domain-containing protein [Nesterenkonia sp.]
MLFEAKAYVVFSFLFGLSFVHQMRAAARDGDDVAARTTRRGVALIVVGVLHGLLLFVGDILLAYAILGFVLLGLRNMGTRRALVIAGLLYGAVSLVVLGVGGLAVLLESADPAAADAVAEQAAAASYADPEEARAAYTGGLGSYLAFQVHSYAAVGPSLLMIQAPLAFAAFLIGLVVGRHRLLERIVHREIPTGRLVAVMTAGLVLGGGLSVWSAALRWDAVGSGSAGAEAVGQGLVLLGGPVQALGYVLALLLILRARAAARLTRLLGHAGRMSLSNYLGQSVVLAVVFSAWGAWAGLGLAGRLTPMQVGLVVVGLWSAQVLLSTLWMRAFRTGPVEGLLRAATYRRRPTWR